MRIQVTERIEPGEYELTPLTAPVPEPPPPPPPVEEPPFEDPPPPPPPPSVEAVTEVWAGEIGWTFAGPTVVGRFVNGDWWCLPTVVASSYPGWDGSRGGSMVNPTGGSNLGYDKLLSYDEAGRAKFPLALQPGMSLISTTSYRPGEPGAGPVATLAGAPRPLIRDAAVLTCLAAPPMFETLRPPYCGARKPLYIFDGIPTTKLPKLPNWPLHAGAPGVASVIDSISRVWLDHKILWTGRYLHPKANMPDYGRDLCATLGDAILMLLCNIPLADKREIAIRLIQIGIDQHAVLENGAIWGGTGGLGGHHSGRRFPTILAGYLLGDGAMLDYFIGKPDNVSCETIQVARDSQGIYWREKQGATRAEPGSEGYRTCCTANAWVAQILACRALGLEAAWDHPDSFEYQDSYMASETGWERAWHDWHGALWDQTDGGRHAP